MPAWKKSKGVVVSSPNFIKMSRKEEVAIVVIDLRKANDVKNGFIPASYAIEEKDLAKAQADFPADKSAPIVLYDEGTASEAAYATVVGWGYKNVTLLEGGFKAWVASEGNVAKEGLKTGKIEYVKIFPKNQVTIDEFKKIVAEKPADKLILDVRDPGVTPLPGAKFIPLAELDGKIGELPKDKEIIIHCNTGILASMAQEKLAAAGLKSRYLNAVVQVSADGTFEVNEK